MHWLEKLALWICAVMAIYIALVVTLMALPVILGALLAFWPW